MATAFLFLSFFVMLFLGLPIAICLGASALGYIVFFANTPPLINYEIGRASCRERV